MTLKQALSQRNCIFSVLGPDLIEHCILLAGISWKVMLTDDFLSDESRLEKLWNSLKENSREILSNIDDPTLSAGIILLEDDMSKGRSKVDSDKPITTTKGRFYDRFDAFLLEQYKHRQFIQYSSFNDAADEFFAQILSQQQEKEHIVKRTAAGKKVEMIRKDQQQRIKQLQNEVSI